MNTAIGLALIIRSALQQILKGIWQRRLFVDVDTEVTEGTEDNHYQPFLQFDNNQIRANNFVGFIQNGDEVIEIYPKVFKIQLPQPTEEEKGIDASAHFLLVQLLPKLEFPFQSGISQHNFDKRVPGVNHKLNCKSVFRSCIQTTSDNVSGIGRYISNTKRLDKFQTLRKSWII